MRWEIPYDKPVIISEFGGGAKYGLHEAKNQRWTEEFQENLYRENLAMLDKINGLAGTTLIPLVRNEHPCYWNRCAIVALRASFQQGKNLSIRAWKRALWLGSNKWHSS